MSRLPRTLASDWKVPKAVSVEDGVSPSNGLIAAFEGIDGAGKSAVLARVHQILVSKTRRKVSCIAFPGHDSGTLGNHVYELHHAPERFGIERVSPLSLQLLHVAAHIDTIDNTIRPSIERGDVVLLDRYWWSAWVYGVVAGVNEELLQSVINLERRIWGAIQPAVIFLFRRAATFQSDSERSIATRLTYEYEKLAAVESQFVRVAIIDNDSTLDQSAQTVVTYLEALLAAGQRVERS